MKKDITGIITCGGKSRRMGMDKSFLKIHGEKLIERTYFFLKDLFESVLIISNEKEKYKYLTESVYSDIYPGLGPLSGIHSGLFNSNTEKNFFLSCDMPFIKSELIKVLTENSTTQDIVIAKSNNFLHTLCGIYSKTCLPESERLLKKALHNSEQNNSKTSVRLMDLVRSCRTNIIDIENFDFFDSDLMFNMNTREDYLYAKAKLEKVKPGF